MKIAIILVGVLLAIIVVGMGVLGSINIPAPSGQIEKQIPLDKLQH